VFLICLALEVNASFALTQFDCFQTLRRHGDEIERTVGGFYRAHGRVDDTMNLGGIKVSIQALILIRKYSFLKLW
jgi:acyl-coenzyme A synthetase/AMP-(fatty) acid ligase